MANRLTRKPDPNYNGVNSDTIRLICGVPQGSILITPLLFLVYINDINIRINNCRVRLYADDTVIYITSIDRPLTLRTKNFV